MSYKVKLEIFEGPLDLLLYLIKREQLNIHDIPIAKITQQYLEYLKLMQMLDLNIAGEFLVMAATLMHIKSKTLLPPEEVAAEEVEEKDPREELVRRLLEYEKFKEAALHMEKLEARQREVFTRTGDQALRTELDGQQYFEASLFDLIRAFSEVMKEVPKETFLEVTKDEVTIEEKIHEILHLLVVETSVYLSRLFQKAKNKVEIIAVFLALLELIRTKEVVARQKTLFGEIQIIRNLETIRPKLRAA